MRNIVAIWSILIFLVIELQILLVRAEIDMASRTINTVIKALEQAEGVGARVRRSVGVAGMRKFNPFLLFDHFSISENSGFPEHPHLGQETITLVLRGAVAHEDFTGSKGVLYSGDLQFMTAGRGVVHSEMPVPQKDGLPTQGIQLWVDLPEALKESPPRYRDLKSYEIPEVVEQDGKLRIKVISGQAHGVDSIKELAYTPIHYYHVFIKPGASYKQEFPRNFNTLLYVLNGSKVMVNGDTTLQAYDNCFFNRDGDHVAISVPDTEDEAELVLVGGQTLDQKVVHYGPFVATSQERIQKGFEDYQLGRNGFEPLKSWNSLISHGVTPEMVNNELHSSLQAREGEKKAFLAGKKKALIHDEL